MPNETELIQQQMEATRGSLTEKLEALEGQVTETVSSTAGAVQETTQSVQETVTDAVDAVKETVTSVTDKVQETMSTVTDKFQETVQSVSDTFNLRIQMERHPWIVMGGAVAIGCLVGSSFGSKKEYLSTVVGSAAPPPPPPWSPPVNRMMDAPASEPEESGAWSAAITHVKNIGVSYLMGLVRDLAQRELPEVVGRRIAEEVDALTTKMGTEPIPGPVLPEVNSAESPKDSDMGNKPAYPEKNASGYRGRAPITATA